MQTETKAKISKLPQNFKPLFWSYNFSTISPQRDIRRVIINTINYGKWEHWQWIFRHYGVKKAKEIIENIPASEFRQGALKLVSLLLKIKKVKYVSRSDKIQAEKNIL